MPALRRLLFFFAVVQAGALISAVASAQDITFPGGYPTRITPGSSSAVTRPENFNPNGVSYSDCMSDMTLQFPLSLDGFTGTTSVEVWASHSSYCTDNTDRGIGSASAVCWEVSPSLVTPLSPTPMAATFNVRVQDLVGWQEAPPTPSGAVDPPLPPAKGSEACTAQPSFAEVPMLINFLPIDEHGNVVGTPYSYRINTDLVGPPAPANVCETVGDSIFNLTWTANSDSDTIGYTVYIDPIPGQEPDGGGVDGGVGTAAADGGGCGSAISTASCKDPALIGAIVASGGDAGSSEGGQGDGGTDSGDPSTASDASVAEGPGGIATISSNYAYNLQSFTTIPGSSSSQYQIAGLVDYDPYTVVISAVDGFGNTGPPSPEVCDYPAPIQDFWQVNEKDGGGPGGFCALDTIGVSSTSLAGVALAVALAAVIRRRRRSAEHDEGPS